MADLVTSRERALIDRYLAERGATVVPTGVSGAAEDAPTWRRMSAADHRRIERARRAICTAAATMTVAEISQYMAVSHQAIYRALRTRGVLAVGMADKR